MASAGHTANAYTSYRNIAVRLPNCRICCTYLLAGVTVQFLTCVCQCRCVPLRARQPRPLQSVCFTTILERYATVARLGHSRCGNQ
jgi:hypothetical protein